jgi:hypothetical protein
MTSVWKNFRTEMRTQNGTRLDNLILICLGLDLDVIKIILGMKLWYFNIISTFTFTFKISRPYLK